MRHRGFLVDVGNVEIRVINSEGKRERSTLEVDFVCNLGAKRYFLQSAYRIPDEEKMQQEKRSLQQIRDSFRKIVIIGERIQLRRDENGIVLIGVYEFLRDESMQDINANKRTPQLEPLRHAIASGIPMAWGKGKHSLAYQ